MSEFLLDAGINAANPERWLEFQTALAQPFSTKPKLLKLLHEPGLLG